MSELVPSPELMFTTETAPEMSLQSLISGRLGMTTISVADTDTMLAAQPARVTATGAWKPCPKIVTGTNGPSARWMLLLIAVIAIGGPYVNVTALETTPLPTLRTVTATGRSPCVARWRGERTTIWL